MGIQASYRRLPPAEWQRICDVPSPETTFYGISWDDGEAMAAWESQLINSGRLLDIDKEWDGLHYLLTGQSCFVNGAAVPALLRNAVIGGTETPFGATYGHV